MQINSHFSPTSLGHGSRPDQAGNAHGKGPGFQPATADVEPAAATDTPNAVVPVEEVEEPTGPGKSGQSTAHQARAYLENSPISSALSALGNNLAGWCRISLVETSMLNPLHRPRAMAPVTA